jgi:phosphoribosylformimino-5-aminoimidazole carboxamide ribotide isomerase
MLIIPAIDLLNGKVVRLLRGDEKTAVVYADDPAVPAAAFEAAGARWIHVVDLDAAFGRPGVNASAVERIRTAVRLPLELGGGIRSIEQARAWIRAGVARVVLGSAAVENPALVGNAVAEFGPEAVVGGIDLRGGSAAIHGWTDDSGMDGAALAVRMAASGVIRVIVTDISTDGALAGPNPEPCRRIARIGLKVILSGGVSCAADLESLRVNAGDEIEGVVVGKALYENRLPLAKAVARFQESGTGVRG